MKLAITNCIHRISKARIAIGTAILVVLIFGTSVDLLLPLFRNTTRPAYGYHTEFLLSALHSDTICSFLPIVAALPFTASYIEEIKCKFARFFLIRTDYIGYLTSNFLACFLSGGSVIALGVLLAWGIATLLLLPMEKVTEISSEYTTLLLKTSVLLSLNGGLWAVLGMTMSTIMESKYIAYASPFIVYYLLVILYERYFPNAWLLYPKNWLDPEIWPYGIGSAALFLLELTFLCGLVFYIRGKRRLEQL